MSNVYSEIILISQKITFVLKSVKFIKETFFELLNEVHQNENS